MVTGENRRERLRCLLPLADVALGVLHRERNLYLAPGRKRPIRMDLAEWPRGVVLAACLAERWNLVPVF